MSQQSHYDFTLRALKLVLASTANIKRERINQIKVDLCKAGQSFDEAKIAKNLPEQEILIQSVCETMEPKLVAEDIPLLFSPQPCVPWGRVPEEQDGAAQGGGGRPCHP